RALCKHHGRTRCRRCRRDSMRSVALELARACGRERDLPSIRTKHINAHVACRGEVAMGLLHELAHLCAVAVGAQALFLNVVVGFCTSSPSLVTYSLVGGGV